MFSPMEQAPATDNQSTGLSAKQVQAVYALAAGTSRKATAKALGMATVWIANGSEAGHVDAHADHIDYTTNHLTPFLADILGA